MLHIVLPGVARLLHRSLLRFNITTGNVCRHCRSRHCDVSVGHLHSIDQERRAPNVTLLYLFGFSLILSCCFVSSPTLYLMYNISVKMSKHKCAVAGCNNSDKNTKNNVQKVHFYRFPSEYVQRNLWARFTSQQK